MRNTARFALAALLVALAAPAVRAQDPELPEDRWGKLTAADVGKRFQASGRWESCWGNQITIHKSAARGFFVADPAIQRELAGNRIPGVPGRNGQLQDKKSRVRLSGRVDKGPGGAIVLVVDRVVKLEDDLPRLKAQAQQAGNNPANIATVAREIQALADKYDDKELRELYVATKARELAVRRETMDEADHKGFLALGEDYAALRERQTAIALFAHVATNGGGELRETALQRLQQLGAVQTSKGWSTFEAFKAGEGFIERKERDGSSRWVRKEEAEFEDLRVAEQQARAGAVVVYRQNPLQHGNNAGAGKLERGQTVEEARAAAGQPLAVFHVKAPESTTANAAPTIWTQWVWADGRRAYFLHDPNMSNHVAFAVKASKDGWPTK